MRYLMRQQWLSWGDDFHIQDQDGNDVYFVDGHVLTWGDKFSFQNLQGHELAFVEQQVLSWGPTYHVSLGGVPYATVKKELFTFFHCKFEVDVPGPDDLLAEGDFRSTSIRSPDMPRPLRLSPRSGSLGRTPMELRSHPAKATCCFWLPPWSLIWSAMTIATIEVLTPAKRSSRSTFFGWTT